MEWLNLVYQILEVCIIPLLGILTAYVIKLIKVKSQEASKKVDNETAKKYISEHIKDNSKWARYWYDDDYNLINKQLLERFGTDLNIAKTIVINNGTKDVFMTILVGGLNHQTPYTFMDIVEKIFVGDRNYNSFSKISSCYQQYK